MGELWVPVLESNLARLSAPQMWEEFDFTCASPCFGVCWVSGVSGFWVLGFRFQGSGLRVLGLVSRVLVQSLGFDF